MGAVCPRRAGDDRPWNMAAERRLRQQQEIRRREQFQQQAAAALAAEKRRQEALQEQHRATAARIVAAARPPLVVEKRKFPLEHLQNQLVQQLAGRTMPPCSLGTPVPHWMLNFKRLSKQPDGSVKLLAGGNISFRTNRKYLMDRLNKHAGGHCKISADIVRLVRAFRPTHRVSCETLARILDHRALLAKGLQHWMTSVGVPTSCASEDETYRHFMSVVTKLAETRPIFVKHYQRLVEKHLLNPALMNPALVIKDSVNFHLKLSSTCPAASVDADSTADSDSKVAVRMIHTELEEVVLAVTNHQKTDSVGYKVDATMSTNQHLFSVFGPHTGRKYGDIAIILKREIMFHPDFNMTPNAGTSFYSGSTLDFRPWAFDRSASAEERIQAFHDSKLHPSALDWDLAVAGELQCMAEKSQQLLGPEGVLQHYAKVDSHFVWHCHLPEMVPLDYIAKIIIPRTYKNSDALRNLDAILRGTDVEWVDGSVSAATQAHFLRRLNHGPTTAWEQADNALTSFTFSVFAPTAGKMRKAVVLPRTTSPSSFKVEFEMDRFTPVRILFGSTPNFKNRTVTPAKDWSASVAEAAVLLVVKLDPTTGKATLQLHPQGHGSRSISIGRGSPRSTRVSISGCIASSELQISVRVGTMSGTCSFPWQHGAQFPKHVGYEAASSSVVGLRNVVIV